MPAQRIITAAARFKDAWAVLDWHRAEGVAVSDPHVAELHEATLGLIRATGADDLQGALAVVSDIESDDDAPPGP